MSLRTICLFFLLVILMVGSLFTSLNAGTPTKYDAVVRLADDNGNTFCTGFVINDATILTAAHCALVEQVHIIDSDLKYTTPGIFSFANPGFIESQDVAVIKGDFSKFKHLKVEFRKDIDAGAKVTSHGYALGGALHSSTGIFTGYIKIFIVTEYVNLIQGMSGGPLTTVMDGQEVVVGINSRIYNPKDSNGSKEQYYSSTINLDTFTGL